MSGQTRKNKVSSKDGRVHFLPKGPWEKGRRSFSLLRVEWRDGKRHSESFTNPEILDLNRRWEDKLVSLEDGKAELLKLRDTLYAKAKEELLKNMHRDNIELIEKFIREVINPKVDILPCSRESEINAVWRIGSMMEKSSLVRASIHEIQRRLNAIETEGAFKHCYKASRSLLKFCGRYKDAEQLRVKKFNDSAPPYLTIDQVKKLVDSIPNEVSEVYRLMRELILICFNLGLRIGEALALEKTDVVKKNGIVMVKVERQLTRTTDANPDGTRVRGTKNRRNRMVIPLDRDETLKALAAWLKEYPKVEDRERYRYKSSKLVHDLCERLFVLRGGDQESSEADDFFFSDASIPDAEEQREYKAMHMLRASHAVYIIEKTGNDVFAANQIGDNPEVMRKHYSGKFNTMRSMETMASLLEQRS
jgi:integrase